MGTRTERLAEFADCLLIGLLITLASVPLVTAAPAFAAGCRAIRRGANSVHRPLWMTYWSDFRGLAKGGVFFTVALTALTATLVLELTVLGPQLPGADVLVPALAVLTAVTVVVALRTCAIVGEGGHWRHALRASTRETVTRPRHALLLAGASAGAVAVVWAQPMLLLVIGGPLSLAVVATGTRR